MCLHVTVHFKHVKVTHAYINGHHRVLITLFMLKRYHGTQQANTTSLLSLGYDSRPYHTINYTLLLIVFVQIVVNEGQSSDSWIHHKFNEETIVLLLTGTMKNRILVQTILLLMKMTAASFSVWSSSCWSSGSESELSSEDSEGGTQSGVTNTETEVSQLNVCIDLMPQQDCFHVVDSHQCRESQK